MMKERIAGVLLGLVALCMVLLLTAPGENAAPQLQVPTSQSTGLSQTESSASTETGGSSAQTTQTSTVTTASTAAESTAAATESVPPATTETAAPTAAPTTIPTTISTTAPTTAPTTEAAQPIQRPVAPYAFVYDPNADWLLYEQGDVNAMIYPASLTKIFTAYVALQHLDPAQEITVGPEVSLIHPQSSVAGLKVGDKLTVKMLVQAMLLPSGNDAAYALAAAAGHALSETPLSSPRAAVDRFMEEVNATAQALGLTGTHYSVPDGIHRTDHYTTAYDLLQMAKLAMENSLIAEVCRQKSAAVSCNGKTWTWTNTNLLLDPGSPFYIAACMGLKTGYEGPAGYCLLAVFPCEDSYRFTLVLKAPTPDDRFADTVWLYQQYLAD